MGKLIDITGNRYGRLVVLKKYGTDKYGKLMWLCQCDCGNTKPILGGALKNGNSTSCGCKALEASTKHGMAGTNIYTIWIDMVRRCHNPKVKQYRNYGARGISVCEEWRTFEYFFRDMGDRPEGKTLDRIKTDGDYCKDNCRWVDNMTQQSNKRNNTYVEYNGERYTLAQWGRILDIDPKLLRSRIFRSNWPIEKAFQKELVKAEDKYKDRKTKELPEDFVSIYHQYIEQKISKSKMAEMCGVSRPTINRLLDEYLETRSRLNANKSSDYTGLL